MLRLALSRGQGSTIWVTTSVATAFPPESAIVSRRSRYSEQPPSITKRAPRASVRSALLNGRIGFPLRQIKHVPDKRFAVGNDDGRIQKRGLTRLLPGDLGLSHQEEVDVIRRQGVVGRRLDLITRPRRTHEMRRDNDGEVGFVLLVGLAGEQRAQHRYAAKPGQLIDRVLVVGLQQATDYEALAITQFDGGGGAAYDQRRHCNTAADGNRVGRVELADLRLDLHVDQAVAEHSRRESKTDTILLVVDGDLAERARNRNWIFAAGEEARGIAGERDQVRFSQAAGESLLFKRVDQDVGR